MFIIFVIHAFKAQKLTNIYRYLKTIDAVLISYPDIAHLGALPYAVGKMGLSCPIYATIPVYKMGQMFLYDAYQSRHANEDFNVFNLDDVDTAFDKFVQLKYSQNVSIKGTITISYLSDMQYQDKKGSVLQIFPLAAGHMIGGTVWRMKKETEEIVYAVDYNHRKERCLS
jgi:cleavage and polyadenylation specificity factor subunit 2